jgi:hypothetical protein
VSARVANCREPRSLLEPLLPVLSGACYPPIQVPFAELASLADETELQRLGPPFITVNCPAGNWVGLAMIGKELPNAGAGDARQRSTQPPTTADEGLQHAGERHDRRRSEAVHEHLP